MILLSILLTICLTCRFGDGVGLHGFHFRGLEEPDSSLFGPQTIDERWIEQPLDHFNVRDNRTWQMRYLENAGYFKAGGPILIMLGGEWQIAEGFLKSGLMFELGSTHNAMMYYTEHRYYGDSKPTKDVTSENLEYLSVDQALADIAYFIETVKKQEGLQNSTVVVFGGSYAGNVAAWSRLKYPHLIQGALASSAPVFAKADFHEYYETVAESLRGYSQDCIDNIQAAFDSVQELLAAKDGPEKLKVYFSLCEVPDVNSPSDLGYFINLLTETFAGIVQYDKVVNGKRIIASCCDTMTATYLGSPLQRLAHLVAKKDACIDNNYKKFIEYYSKGAWNAQGDITRQWYYQTCSEYGYYQTVNSKKSIFGSLVPLSYFTGICVDLYGEYFNSKLLNTRVRRTNIMYGGNRPDLRNVIFSNGNLDPWHNLSVLDDLNESSPAIFIKGSSHCRDLYSDTNTDVQDLIQARSKIRKIISTWISS